MAQRWRVKQRNRKGESDEWMGSDGGEGEGRETGG